MFYLGRFWSAWNMSWAFCP